MDGANNLRQQAADGLGSLQETLKGKGDSGSTVNSATNKAAEVVGEGKGKVEPTVADKVRHGINLFCACCAGLACAWTSLRAHFVLCFFLCVASLQWGQAVSSRALQRNRDSDIMWLCVTGQEHHAEGEGGGRAHRSRWRADRRGAAPACARAPRCGAG